MADIPKIRFKGFTEPWEQRKLIDVCDYVDYRGKTPTKTDSGVFLVTAKNVKDGYIDYGVSQEYISEDDYEEVMHRGKPEIGDVLITTEAPCGNVAQVNRADIALAQRIIKYRGQSNIVDNTYLKDYLQSPEFQNILNAKSSGGTVKGIKGSILHQQEIKYPKYEEQFKIGSYFNNLDNLVTLHQRKCDDTKELKKYMLQKMFPKNGEKFPEIRFKGFTEAWEQRKLSELLYLSSERNDGSYTRDDVLAASLGTELQKKHIYFGLRATDESVKNYKVVLPNDVIYTKSPIKGFPNGIIRTSKGENGIVPTLYCVYHSIDVINPSIIQAYFESKERLDAYLIPLVNIGARNNVNITDKEFLEGAICIPKDKAEQDKIVDVLERLSNLITLHQRKCDTLKELKKYMLQNMFPKKG